MLGRPRFRRVMPSGAKCEKLPVCRIRRDVDACSSASATGLTTCIVSLMKILGRNGSNGIVSTMGGFIHSKPPASGTAPPVRSGRHKNHRLKIEVERRDGTASFIPFHLSSVVSRRNWGDVRFCDRNYLHPRAEREACPPYTSTVASSWSSWSVDSDILNQRRRQRNGPACHRAAIAHAILRFAHAA